MHVAAQQVVSPRSMSRNPTRFARFRAHRGMFLLTVSLIAWLCIAQTTARPYPDPHEIMRRMGRAYEGIHDYQTLFFKRERIKDALQPLEQIDFRSQNPHKVYMSWRKPHAGRTITYVPGENDNRIRVNPGGLLSCCAYRSIRTVRWPARFTTPSSRFGEYD